MSSLIATRGRRAGWTVLAFLLALAAIVLFTKPVESGTQHLPTTGEIMARLLGIPSLVAFGTMFLLSACVSVPLAKQATAKTPTAAPQPAKPFVAQVVGVQWLNPLQRLDYSTEWQLLWTLGLVKPNKNDDMVRTKPQKYSTLQYISSIAYGDNGKESFSGYHHKYVRELTTRFHGVYFSSSRYFYNAHALKDRSTRRELAGIHVEYALPEGRLDPVEAASFVRDRIMQTFSIGNTSFPDAWTHDTPPDVRVTLGGANAGFTSLKAALDYLQVHPDKTVWVMNWDAPGFPPSDEKLSENMVLLVLAGPNYKTEREALAWIGYPATRLPIEFDARKGFPSRAVQAWRATIIDAAAHAGKLETDIGYIIHDAQLTHPDSPERIARLAQTLTMEVPEFDYDKQTFNTPALLGDMGAGTALTNVALGIAYANHMGKHVLVAGATELERPTAVLVSPPGKARPIEPGKPWFRARGGNHAYLMWWGIRHDEEHRMQGFSD